MEPQMQFTPDQLWYMEQQRILYEDQQNNPCSESGFLSRRIVDLREHLNNLALKIGSEENKLAETIKKRSYEEKRTSQAKACREIEEAKLAIVELKIYEAKEEIEQSKRIIRELENRKRDLRYETKRLEYRARKVEHMTVAEQRVGESEHIGKPNNISFGRFVSKTYEEERLKRKAEMEHKIAIVGAIWHKKRDLAIAIEKQKAEKKAHQEAEESHKAAEKAKQEEEKQKTEQEAKEAEEKRKAIEKAKYDEKKRKAEQKKEKRKEKAKQAAEEKRKADEKAKQIAKEKALQEEEQRRFIEKTLQEKQCQEKALEEERRYKKKCDAEAKKRQYELDKAAQIEKERQVAEAVKVRKAIKAEEDRIAEEAKQIRLAKEAEQKRLAYEAEQTRLAAQAKQNSIAEESKRIYNAHDALLSGKMSFAMIVAQGMDQLVAEDKKCLGTLSVKEEEKYQRKWGWINELGIHVQTCALLDLFVKNGEGIEVIQTFKTTSGNTLLVQFITVLNKVLKNNEEMFGLFMTKGENNQKFKNLADTNFDLKKRVSKLAVELYTIIDNIWVMSAEDEY